MWEIPCVAKCTVVPVWQDELFTYMTPHIFVCGTTCEKSLVWQNVLLSPCDRMSCSHIWHFTFLCVALHVRNPLCGRMEICSNVQRYSHTLTALFKCATNDSGMLLKWKWTSMESCSNVRRTTLGCCSNENTLSMESYSNVRYTPLDVVQMQMQFHGK